MVNCSKPASTNRAAAPPSIRRRAAQPRRRAPAPKSPAANESPGPTFSAPTSLAAGRDSKLFDDGFEGVCDRADFSLDRVGSELFRRDVHHVLDRTGDAPRRVVDGEDRDLDLFAWAVLLRRF